MSIDDQPKPGAKDVFNVIRKSPALLITGIIGVIVIGYILIKNSQASSGATADTSSGATTTSPGGYYTPQPYIEPITITTPTPASTQSQTSVATVPSTAQDDIIRTRYSSPTVTSYDTTHAGVPIRSAPAANSTDTTSYAPFGSKIQVTGPAISGSSNLGGNNGTAFWYPVAGGGYISAFDVQSSYPAANTVATVPSNN